MTHDDGQIRYSAIRRRSTGAEPAHRLPFDVTRLAAAGIVVICEVDDPPPGNSRPSLSIRITQCLRLSDHSMIRLDMDRGVSSFMHGRSETVSWKRSAADVIAEVLTLVKADSAADGTFPWEQYAAAAQLRGLQVEASHLCDLPVTVLLSDDVVRIHEF